MSINSSLWGRGVLLTGSVPTATLTGFVVIYTEDNFPAEMMDDGPLSAINGGGDIRNCVNIDGSGQLPLEVLSFVTNATPSLRKAQVWSRFATYAAAAANRSSYFFYKKAGEVQPAVGASFGRNEVWQDFVSAYVHSNGTDSAGNFDLTESGSGSTSATSTDSGIDGISFDGSVSLSNASWTKLTYPISVSFWGRRDASAATQCVFSQGNPSLADWDSLLIRNGSNYEISISGANRAATSALADNVWDYSTVKFDTSDFEVLIDKVSEATGGAGSQDSDSMTKFALGELVRSVSELFYEGDLAAILVKNTVITDAEHDSSFDNQSSPSTFWTTGTPFTPSGGLTISPVSIPSEESWGTPALSFDQILQPTSIPSEESFGTPTILAEQTISPGSIPSEESWGIPTLISSIIIISPTSIPSEESWGIAVIIGGEVIIVSSNVIVQGMVEVLISSIIEDLVEASNNDDVNNRWHI